MSGPTVDPEHTLTQCELNRALLARQLPLERVEATVPRALERRGLQAQYAPSMYLGLFSRLADLPRESLTRPLERGTAQATLMRAAREDERPAKLHA